MDHLEPVRARVLATGVGSPPFPWFEAGTWAVGGLIEIGFAAASDLLLVVSWQGRGVLDPHARVRVAREPGEPNSLWYDEFRLVARGIGPLIDEQVNLSGLHGGALANGTKDGWWVESITLAWPDQHLLLGGPRGSIYDENASFAKLAIESDVRAFGFSATGRTAVLATSSDVRFWTRT